MEQEKREQQQMDEGLAQKPSVSGVNGQPYEDGSTTVEAQLADRAEVATAEQPYPQPSSEAKVEERAGFALPAGWELALYGVLVAVAGIMRLWDLGSRAMHHDESLHAVYSWYLYVGRGYVHFPMMHGPFQFHANALMFFLFGDSNFSARLGYAIFGTALVGMPYLFRQRLGQTGALMAAVLLAFSPTMLYFSRFARNDILMAVWTLGLVICIWRYMDERKNLYLYIMAALLALAFSTKETSFILVAILGSFLLALASPEVWLLVRRRIKLSELSPAAALLLIFITLTIPQWSAAVSLLQKWLRVTLASSETGPGPIGAPDGGGLVVAGVVVFLLIGASVAVGVRWNRGVWLRCAAVFYSIWALLYTTVFTNMLGIGTGMWQSLGYWIVQQEVRRGGQPWYYYFVITPTYEFLPLLFAVVGAVYYTRKRDLFGGFLAFWSILTLFLYSMAGEKMPWLLVNVALPLIVLAGKFLGDLAQQVQWRRLAGQGGLLLAPLAVLFVLFLWRLAFFKLDTDDLFNVVTFVIVVAIVLGALAAGQYLSRRVGRRGVAAFSALALAGILLVVTIRAGWLASFRNGDVPVEMLVYTQTSPDIPRVARGIDLVAKYTSQGRNLKITIDSTDGYTWPWAWYLRDYTSVGYPCYSAEPGCISLREPPDSAVVVVNASNNPSAKPVLESRYNEVMRVKHRWWFPESYRVCEKRVEKRDELGKVYTYVYTDNVCLTKAVGKGLTDRQQWRRSMDYFLYRKFGTEIGSIDAYVYLSKDIPVQAFLTP